MLSRLLQNLLRTLGWAGLSPFEIEARKNDPSLSRLANLPSDSNWHRHTTTEPDPSPCTRLVTTCPWRSWLRKHLASSLFPATWRLSRNLLVKTCKGSKVQWAWTTVARPPRRCDGSRRPVPCQCWNECADCIEPTAQVRRPVTSGCCGWSCTYK